MTHNFLIFPQLNGKPVYQDGKPVYWMDETSGEMEEIVLAYLNKKPLDSKQFIILKEYILQFAMHPDFKVDDEMLNKISDAANVEELRLLDQMLFDCYLVQPI